MTNMLHLEGVDLFLSKNRLDHHTNQYESKQLILRRGQPFQITLKLNRELRANDNITFITETGNSPDIDKGTKATFPLSTSEVTKVGWRAFTKSATSNLVTVWITPPVNAIIGSYRMIVCFSPTYASYKLPGFTLLFNPWAIGDSVYLANESERKEYVLSDSTIIYVGNENSIAERGWNLGQFEEEILIICLLILEKQKFVDISVLHDPKQVSRVCSAMVNSNDDKGVLQGNWSGDYSGGRNPSSWSGSVAILKKWATSGPVEYGQCWVFAGVLCTVMRSLGIPNRIVTNFSSAHDTDGNLSIDTYYDSNGNNCGGSDSVWNFHVWNEAWFTREDIGSYYDGWQVLDATPQETSCDVYRLGPTSVKAVKEGDVHLNYDGAFVFSEVNADRISWIYHEKRDYFERIKTNTSSVGKCTSTKAVGTHDRVDITFNYKYEEGTAKEREAYSKALLNLHSRWTGNTDNIVTTSSTTAIAELERAREISTQCVSGKFKESETSEFGQDINLTLVLSNEASSNKTITVNFNANVTGYTRRVMTNILAKSVSIPLSAKQEKEIPFSIPYSTYKDSLQDDKVVEVTALCKWEREKLLISQIITLKHPSIIIKVCKVAALYHPISAEVTFMNPFIVNTADFDFYAEGSGLIRGQIKKNVSLKPKEETTVTIKLTPYMKGSKQLNVTIGCNGTTTMKGFKTIDVKDP